MTSNPAAWPPKMAVCVGAVVLEGRRALLVRQAPGASLAGQWSIPWGLVDPDESPQAAALRETREEAGVTIEVEGLLGIQNLPQAGWLGVVFLCRPIAGEPVPDGSETDRAGYFSLEELEALDDPVEPWCAWLIGRVLRGERPVIPGQLPWESPGNRSKPDGFGISLLTRGWASAPAQKPHPGGAVSGKPLAGGVGVRHKTGLSVSKGQRARTGDGG